LRPTSVIQSLFVATKRSTHGTGLPDALKKGGRETLESVPKRRGSSEPASRSSRVRQSQRPSSRFKPLAAGLAGNSVGGRSRPRTPAAIANPHLDLPTQPKCPQSPSQLPARSAQWGRRFRLPCHLDPAIPNFVPPPSGFVLPRVSAVQSAACQQDWVRLVFSPPIPPSSSATPRSARPRASLRA
jgi:hypothetical protein